ncbi:hypothetical protein AJ79_07897 [Helicocarpus griseus UAMH5409]|uniref:Transglycosylase SLT domain-containing protein n=1 Tax=Helicocarpus griseus UAMH5409 TaxID=1447875 RepID=A0A2B7WY67_9EURO|nr:hypothetical protein AJ79_07897 [Helicocarpus griseus UAMH5409]
MRPLSVRIFPVSEVFWYNHCTTTTNVNLQILLLLVAIITLAVASPVNLEERTWPAKEKGGAKCYKGTEFPKESEWLPWNKLVAKANPILNKFNTPAENKHILKYIQELAKKYKLDKRVVLETMMQESKGDLRTKPGDGVTPGLLQALHSPHCQNTKKGKCPKSKIKQMLEAGIKGTKGTEGLAKCYTKNGKKYGAMARCYNSGNIINPKDWTKIKYGTPEYVSDIGNRLRGLEPPTNCGFGNRVGSPGH